MNLENHLKLKILIHYLLLGIVGILAFSEATAQAEDIDVKPLTGEIFFIGFSNTQEFMGQGAAHQLYVISANGTGQQRLLPSFNWIAYLASYPNIKKLSFKSISDDKSKNGRFFLNINEPWQADQLQSRLTHALPDNFPVRISAPISFSPDGSLVAGVARVLQIADVKTEAVKNVEGQFVPGGDLPAWSPDGEKIVFRGCLFNDEYSNAFELFVVDKDGNNLRQLTNLPQNISWWRLLLTPSTEQPKYKEQHASSSPKWSPDGKWIVFVSFENIYKVRPDGSDLTLLVKHAAYPTWSPDGKMISYAAFRPGTQQLTKEEGGENAGYRPPNIYVSWADGKGETRITNNRRRLGYVYLNWIK